MANGKTKKRLPRGAERLKADAYIRAYMAVYNQDGTYNDLALVLQKEVGHARNTFQRLRRHGVDLPRLRRAKNGLKPNPALDIDGLNQLVGELKTR